MKILITGIAGFVGYFTALSAVNRDYDIVGIDNINDYYDINLKIARLAELGLLPEDCESKKYKNLRFKKIDIYDTEKILALFLQEKFDCVIHLAAQAGVRYSIENPLSYMKSNGIGFLNILEGSRHNKVKHLIYASSSSVYGENKKIPFAAKDSVDHPVSLYAATKRANELMAHTYSHLYEIPTTGLRYFTVYGPWGRPDMAPFIFTDSILNGKPLKIFNNGKMERDFTYVEDIVEAQMRLIDIIPSKCQSTSSPNISTAPFKIYNIGSSRPINLMDFIQTLEKTIGKEAEKVMMPAQPGDVTRTYADVEDLFSVVNYRPTTSMQDGIKSFVDWYKGFYS